MTALTENTGGRLIPRWTGPPIAHDVRFIGDPNGGIIAECEPCGWRVHVPDWKTAADLTRLTAEHQGDEAP
jgi:hypothetical protein